MLPECDPPETLRGRRLQTCGLTNEQSANVYELWCAFVPKAAIANLLDLDPREVREFIRRNFEESN